MKKLILAAFFVAGTLAVQAGGYHHYGGYHYHYWGRGPAVSVYWGPGWYGPGYSYWSYPVYAPYPSYAYSPGYVYDGYYSRPNYAVSGTLLGALTGGIIGNSIHHQGWEGAGIGAAAGLVLGSVAEHSARVNEQAAYSAAPPVYYNYAQPASVPTARTVNNAPVAPAAPQVQSVYQPAYGTASSGGTMAGANSLFGR